MSANYTLRMPFDDAWKANFHFLTSSCKQYPGSPENNSGDDANDKTSDKENALIYKAICKVSDDTGLPKELLLAVMIQESKGCVRAPTTNYGVNNPGLFQSFNGQGTCNPDNSNFQTPCPEATILKMVQEGAGVGLEFGLTQAIDQAVTKYGAKGVDKYFKGMRIYNSGSLPASGNLGQGIATHCYASDIANRLMGWASEDKVCDEATIGNMGGSSGNGGETQPPTETPPPTNNNPQPTNPQPTNPQPTNPQPSQPNHPTTDNPSSPKAEGYDPNCKTWYEVKDGDTCESTGIAFDTLRKLNTKLDDKCSNLWLGYAYCASV